MTISAAADVRKLSQRFELLASDPSSAWTLANELEVKSVTSAVTEWQFDCQCALTVVRNGRHLPT